jgi:hypothetical protein
MNVKETSLTVQPPIPQKKLGRYRAKKGVFLIRQNSTVLYIGASENIYKTAMRLFQKGGALSAFSYDRLSFEIVLTSFRSPSVENVLKRHFVPQYNRRIQKLIKPTCYEKRQCKRILDGFLSQTRFEVQGEHSTDLNNS